MNNFLRTNKFGQRNSVDKSSESSDASLASRCWRLQQPPEDIDFLRASSVKSTLTTNWFWMYNFKNCGIITQFVAICYSNSRKLIWLEKNVFFFNVLKVSSVVRQIFRYYLRHNMETWQELASSDSCNYT